MYDIIWLSLILVQAIDQEEEFYFGRLQRRGDALECCQKLADAEEIETASRVDSTRDMRKPMAWKSFRNQCWASSQDLVEHGTQ